MENKSLISSPDQDSADSFMQTRSYCMMRSNKLLRKSYCPQDSTTNNIIVEDQVKKKQNNVCTQVNSVNQLMMNNNNTASTGSTPPVISNKSFSCCCCCCADRPKSSCCQRPKQNALAISGNSNCDTKMGLIYGHDDNRKYRQRQQDESLNLPKMSPRFVVSMAKAAKQQIIRNHSLYSVESQVKNNKIISSNEAFHPKQKHQKYGQSLELVVGMAKKRSVAGRTFFALLVLLVALFNNYSPNIWHQQQTNRQMQQQSIIIHEQLEKSNQQHSSLGWRIYAKFLSAQYYLARYSSPLSLILFANAQQYKPIWPHKTLEQEIFLLNLEDGYFGCQVNSSQDFLQLFELSRLCDGQPQCFLGSDELAKQFKCRDRERCEVTNSTSGQRELVHCVNGVCLDNQCYCNDGYGGLACDIPDENECKYRPCDVFSYCKNTLGSYYCSCLPGYDGDGYHCQDINECEIPSLRALCSDNSECVNLPGHFVCKCKPGYQQSSQSQSSLTGAPVGNATVQCTDIDECLDERACGKGAVCENLPGSFRCSCPHGFAGDPIVECFDMDECRNNPCGIGAQCTNIPGGYRCSCKPGHERNPSAPAHMFGTILLGSDQQQQQQLAELTNTSLIACLDINECQVGQANNKPVCGTGAQCINTPGAFFCQCPQGYTGNANFACVDVDECASNGCGPNAQCKNLPGSYKCECKPGYSGNAYSAEGCQDEDECLRKDACGLNAQCFNTLGSFQCTCLNGFTGDAYSKCFDVDECATTGAQGPCGAGAQCHNIEGGYKCTCPDKYLARGTPEMGCERAAVDIGCEGDFDCTRNAHCVNATCQCKLGFQISGIDCVDVDECAVSVQQQQQQQQQQQHQQQQQQQQQSGTTSAPVKAFTRLNLAAQRQNANNNLATTNLCGPEATCHNTDGSYKCECKTGYEKIEPQVANSKCRDVNECERNPAGPCGPNSKCFNTDGAYKCLCNDGFIPIDPAEPSGGCKSPCDGVTCGQHATCKPHGEEAACVCKPGFTFDPNNIKLGCVDINECDTNYGPSGLCGQKAICTNVPGSYRCHCPSGFAGDAYRYCEDINECDRKFGVFGQCGELAICTNKPGSFSCSCAPGYTGDPKTKCLDVDECSSKFGPNGKCGLNAICTNTPGRYSCRCPDGYTGDPNDKCVAEQPVCSVSSECPTNQLCQSGRCQCPFALSADGQCRHPCEKSECGAHATCQLDSDNQPLCVCDAGYMAPGDGRSGCVDVNECIQGVALSGITPISALTSSASIPLGLGASNSTGTGHPCGRNAICRNQPGSFDCVCPPGYLGNAYESCILDTRNQQAASPNTSSSSIGTTIAPLVTNQPQDAFGNYLQEPRTTSCADACQRGFLCFDGQCVKPDSCRDNENCRKTHSCEHVNQALGFQCVNVCELNQCGPDAKCTPLNHKPICACNSTAGYAGDPYDLTNGCRLQTSSSAYTKTPSESPASTSSLIDQFSPLATSKQHPDQFDLHRTTVSNNQQQQTSGDTSTTSVDFGPSSTVQQHQQQQQQQHTLIPSTVTTVLNNNTMDQLKRQQVLEQHQQPNRPHQPLIAYELPLPTTPLLPQHFDVSQQQSQTTTGDQFSGTSTGGLLSNMRNQQQQVEQSSHDRQEFGNDSVHQQQQQQKQQQQQQQQQQSGHSKTTVSLFPSIDRTQTTTTLAGQYDTGSFDQFSNKSAITATTAAVTATTTATTTTTTMSGINRNGYTTSVSSKQVACTSEQHCPGNLFCLGYESSGFDSHTTKSSLQKSCGCPPGYRREADFCYMQRVNCTSSSVCKPREECISANILRQSYASSPSFPAPTTISQQFALGADDQSSVTNLITSGICICPRGYKLVASGLACVDRNECDEGTPCAVGAICENKIGSYECVCPPGTKGDPYTKTCEPLIRAECQTNSDCASDRECDLAARKCVSPCHVCGPRAICTATNHAAICLCPPRYTGNAIDQVYGCQEPPTTTVTTTSSMITNATTIVMPGPTTTTTPRPASNIQTAPPSLIGVPVTTMLPPSPTTGAPVDTTTSELVEFRTIPPSELFVMCLADGIQVEMQLGGFDGIIYVKGHSQDPKCRKLVSSNAANEFVDFKVQFGSCDLIHRDGEAGFVLVIQKHPKLVTYRARAYHVKCVYNTGERTVTLGFNVSMITTSGTIANTGPPPTCLMSITSLEGREVTSAEIGQDLLLRVDVQPDSIYGGFARSCEAKTMDDEGEYQYEVTDANGCATDPSIFSDWKYDQHKKSLVARFNAFKFPSSNNLRFQCNIRVCFGSCPAVNCNGIDAYGKRRRRREAPEFASDTLNLTNPEAELDAPADELIVTDTFKEGALREEIMVQSNAILTFDKKEASFAQQQQRPTVEDIEFVCLPRLGLVMSIALTTVLIMLALAVASSCWCVVKRKRARTSAMPIETSRKGASRPLPHPVDFPNPLMRSTSASTLRESLYEA